MKINIDYPSLGVNGRDVSTSVQIANAVQNYFHLFLRDEDHCEEGPEVDAESFYNSLHESEKKNICITDKPLADNWFSHEYRNSAIISLADWNGIYAPPSMKSYLIYQIAQALIHFAAELTEEIALSIVHEPPQGCMYDMCINKPDIKLGMVAGSLCPNCKATLSQFGTSIVAIEAIEKLLEYVRLEAIGKPKLIDPKKAFIVMRFSANDENDHAYQYGIKPALEELHIDCTRSDTEVRSAQLLEEIKNNIDKSPFSHCQG